MTLIAAVQAVLIAVLAYRSKLTDDRIEAMRGSIDQLDRMVSHRKPKYHCIACGKTLRDDDEQAFLLGDPAFRFCAACWSQRSTVPPSPLGTVIGNAEDDDSCPRCGHPGEAHLLYAVGRARCTSCPCENPTITEEGDQ